MNTDQLSHPIVKAAVNALNAGDRQGWLALFTPDATLTDDGSPANLVEWSDSEIFGKGKGRVLSIDRVEDNGLLFYAKFHSDAWGDFKTSWKFEIHGGKITRLDVGQVH